MSPKEDRPSIPVFASCSIVPYWSRPACGLKVPVRLGRPETDPEHLSTKVTQAFYVGVRGAPMKELVESIAEIVSQSFDWNQFYILLFVISYVGLSSKVEVSPHPITCHCPALRVQAEAKMVEQAGSYERQDIRARFTQLKDGLKLKYTSS